MSPTLPDAVEIDAPAKLNLFLEVHGRRADGYHELVTVMQRVSLADTLRVVRIPEREVRISCDAPGVPATADNLAARGARAVLEELGWPGGVAIELTKRVPHGAGLGGGSSDAASAMLATVALFGATIAEPRLSALAATIGSDVPFFLADGVARCLGRGTEIDRTAPGTAFRALVIAPERSLATPLVYRALASLPPWTPRDDDTLWRDLETGATADRWASAMFNRLEAAACLADPVMEALGRALRARFPGAMMTGSGSAWFVVQTGEPRDAEIASGGDRIPRMDLGAGLPPVRVHEVQGVDRRPVVRPWSRFSPMDSPRTP